MAEVKDRKDIKEEYKWSLEDVFASDEEWENSTKKSSGSALSVPFISWECMETIT